MAADGDVAPSLVISVAALSERERASLRCTTLLSRNKLTASWRISDVDNESHCRIVAPAKGTRDGHIEFGNPVDGSTVMVEVDWPLSESSLIRALNMTSDRLRTAVTPINPRTSWISTLLRGSGGSQAATMPSRDDSRSITSYLKRFGLLGTTPTINILFAGPPGSGKTTAISSASTILTRTTEAVATDDVGTLKQRTTISIDYGECDVDGHHLRLFGTPGQLRFAYMIGQTLHSCDAVILLADMTSPQPLDDVARYAGLLGKFVQQGRPLIVGLTHLDIGHIPKHFHGDLCRTLSRRVPTVPLDPRSQASIRRALTVLTGVCHADTNPMPLRA